jgi:hypothetical protein
VAERRLPKLLSRIEGQWIIFGKKHRGKSLLEVALRDPEYLQWLHRERFEDMDDETFYALEDVMVEYKIPLFESRKDRVASNNAPRRFARSLSR